MSNEEINSNTVLGEEGDRNEVLRGAQGTGNEPDPLPLSQEGYVVHPDGTVGHPGENWDKEP